MTSVTVLGVASEIFPLIKTGGLADVAGALPAALAAEGVQVTTLVPGYPAVLDGLDDATPAHHFAELFGGPARLLRGRAAGLDLLAIDAPHLYAPARQSLSGAGRPRLAGQRDALRRARRGGGAACRGAGGRCIRDRSRGRPGNCSGGGAGHRPGNRSRVRSRHRARA